MIINNRDQLLKISQAQPISGGYHVKDTKCNLMFNLQTQIQCERISFYSSTITIQNLNLMGSLAFYNCSVTILNSQITRNEAEKEFVLITDEKTILIASNLKINSSDLNCIQIQNNCTCSFTNCKFSNFLKGMTIQKSSKVFVIDCEMKNSQNIDDSECINIIDNSDVQILNSKFENCKSIAIRCSKSFLNISSSSSFAEIGQKLS
jgi:hypothetical protein